MYKINMVNKSIIPTPINQRSKFKIEKIDYSRGKFIFTAAISYN